MIPITDREIKNAWRINRNASEVERKTNAHRLLLFYSVECGLKALLLKRKRLNRSDECPEISEIGHDINKLLDKLHAGGELRIPNHLYISPIRNRRGENIPRQFTNGEINQVWRYGARCHNFSHHDLEADLQKLNECSGAQL